MSNDLEKDREWLKRLVAAMDEICLSSSGASALDSQAHSLLQRLKLPAAASASDLARIPPACLHSC
jgi:hypothetical protein